VKVNPDDLASVKAAPSNATPSTTILATKKFESGLNVYVGELLVNGTNVSPAYEIFPCNPLVAITEYSIGDVEIEMFFEVVTFENV